MKLTHAEILYREDAIDDPIVFYQPAYDGYIVHFPEHKHLSHQPALTEDDSDEVRVFTDLNEIATILRNIGVKSFGVEFLPPIPRT